MAIEVALAGTSDSEAEFADGYLLYRGALGRDTNVIHRVTFEGTEDFIAFERAPTRSRVDYSVRLRPDVAGLRLVAHTLEFLDAGGVPRLRVAPPYLVDIEGTRHAASLDVAGCAVDRDPRPPYGRQVTAAGAEECIVRVEWDGAAVVYPALLDPAWTTTGSMATARRFHTASRLGDGRVLVVGGHDGSTSTGSVEVYDPASGTWAAAPGLSPREHHTATVLTDGRVLVTGFWTNIYDPSSGTWTSTANPLTGRQKHTATRILNGRVLVTGGTNSSGTLASAEIYDPVLGSWLPTADMSTPRTNHTATLLSDQRVLVVGGTGGTNSIWTAEWYEPTSQTWSPTAGPTYARIRHTASALPNGNVLVVGNHPTTEVYNPTSGVWTPATTLSSSFVAHTATLPLLSSDLLFVGGWTGSNALADARIYDPGWVGWLPAPSMASARAYHTATALVDGRVLVAGGGDGTSVLASAEIFDDTLGEPCTVAATCQSGHCVDGVCCDTPCGGGMADDCQACSVSLGGASDGICSVVADTAQVCRAGGDVCDPAETCDGASPACPADVWAPNGTVCRAGSGDACDPDEVCTGASSACPVDVVLSSGAVCRAGSGDACDPDESCTGVPGAGCPIDEVQASGTLCRPSAGSCDVTEACSGAPGDPCPIDGFVAQGETGEPSCEPYLCSGQDALCPMTCGTSDDCAPGHYCAGGACEEKGEQGAACGSDEACRAGPCVDGVCCDTECDGPCEACDTPAALGTCSFVAAGEDADDECADGACNGAGTCAADDGQPCAQDSECLSGHCVDGVCCDSACGRGEVGDCQACSVRAGAAQDGRCEPLGAGVECRPAEGPVRRGGSLRRYEHRLSRRLRCGRQRALPRTGRREP